MVFYNGNSEPLENGRHCYLNSSFLLEIRNEMKLILHITSLHHRCWSQVGRSQSSRPVMHTISIGRGCETKGIVIHEILHLLGFYHEQSRPDRDRYIKVHLENIAYGKLERFSIKSTQNCFLL